MTYYLWSIDFPTMLQQSSGVQWTLLNVWKIVLQTDESYRVFNVRKTSNALQVTLVLTKLTTG